MTGVYDVWGTFVKFMGTRIWIVLFIISIIYIFFREQKRNRKTIAIFVGVSVLLLYNDWAQRLIAKFSSYETYYRFFWLIPVTLICAYAMLLWLNHKTIPKTVRIGIFAAVLVVLIVTQNNFYDLSIGTIPDNKYLTSDDLVVLADQIKQDKEEDKPTVAAPNKMEMAYISYDAGAVMGIGANAYMCYYGRYDWNPECTEEYIHQKELLISLVNEGQSQNEAEMKAAIIANEIDYLIVPTDCGLEGYMENLGCEFIYSTGRYLLYRYIYADYSAVEDPQQAQDIIDEAGIMVNDVEIDLGLSEEKQLLVVCDLHDLTLDSTVSEDNASVVNDRYSNQFVSSTGIHSMDLWSSMSSVLDTFDSDGIIFCGDMIDYCSKTNVNLLEQGMSRLSTEYIYLRADHDLAAWYSDTLTDDETMTLSTESFSWQDVYMVDYGEFILLGWNNSTSQMTAAGLETVKQAYATGKPIILMTHVPLESTVSDTLYTWTF